MNNSSGISVYVRTLLFCIAGVAILFYILVCNEKAVKFLTSNFKTVNRPLPFQLDKYKYGDLYGMAYLPDFKELVTDPLYQDDRSYPEEEKNMNLWCIGDSYLRFALIPGKSEFLSRVEVKDFTKSISLVPTQIHLEPSKKNILLIETVEKYVRRHFSSTNFYCRKYFIGKPAPERERTP